MRFLLPHPLCGWIDSPNFPNEFLSLHIPGPVLSVLAGNPGDFSARLSDTSDFMMQRTSIVMLKSLYSLRLAFHWTPASLAECSEPSFHDLAPVSLAVLWPHNRGTCSVLQTYSAPSLMAMCSQVKIPSLGSHFSDTHSLATTSPSTWVSHPPPDSTNVLTCPYHWGDHSVIWLCFCFSSRI